jgi:ABC-type antimicrobial peptide transport system permease subunit
VAATDLTNAADGGRAPDPVAAATDAGVLRGIGGDVRYALRSLRRSPGYTAVVIVTLGLGIGAASATQAVIDPLLLRPLSFHDPDRLVTIDTGLLPGEYEIIRQHTNAFEQTSLVRTGGAFGVSGDGTLIAGVTIVVLAAAAAAVLIPAVRASRFEPMQVLRE